MILEKQGDAQAALAAYRKAVELNPADLSAKAGARAACRGGAFVTLTLGRHDDCRGRAFPDGRPRRRYSSGEVQGGRAAARRVREGTSALVVGLVRARLQPVRAAEDRRLDCVAGEIPRARRHQRRSSQDPRAQPDDHRPVRRRAGRVRTGAPLQAGFCRKRYNLGKLFSIQDNWEPARKQFEAALRIDPAYLEAIDALGFALEALGDDAGALAAYQKAIALNKERKGTFVSPLVNMSAYYNRTGDAAKALEYADQAIELDSHADRAWFQKGRAYERQGKLQEAVEALNRAISSNPRSSSYYYVLAGVYRRLGLMDENQKALETFRRLEREASELEEKRRGARTIRDRCMSCNDPRRQAGPIAPAVLEPHGRLPRRLPDASRFPALLPRSLGWSERSRRATAAHQGR